MSFRYSFLLLFAAACATSGSGDTDTSSSTVEPREFSDFVNTTEAPTGDLTCKDAALGTVDPAKQVDVTFNGEVHDFQLKDVVAEATVNFWFDDDVSATMSTTVQADTKGAFTVDLPACTPLAYESTTPVDWQQTVDTYEVHQIYGYEEDGSVDGEYVNSVSQQTSTLIPALIGLEWDPTTGIIAGTAYDCTETGIGNAQVFIHDEAGNAPPTGEIFYFNSSDLPTARDPEDAATARTNPDNGLWVAINVPVGVWIAEMYIWDGSTYVMLGSTQLEIKAGSVNISNIYTGHTDGIAYPPSCLVQ